MSTRRTPESPSRLSQLNSKTRMSLLATVVARPAQFAPDLPSDAGPRRARRLRCRWWRGGVFSFGVTPDGDYDVPVTVVVDDDNYVVPLQRPVVVEAPVSDDEQS